MDRLILFRHGKAEPDSDSGDDFDRRLAPRGVEESADMGAHLASLGFSPDLVLVSSAVRTRETWASMKETFPAAESRVVEHLYHADSGTIRAAADTAREGRGIVMVVGHNPGLQELTVQLLQEGGAPQSLIGRAMRDFPPAAAAVFLFDDNGRPHYDGLFFPGRHH